MRYCSTPGCPMVVRKGHCSQHERAQDQGIRGTAHQRGYTWQWTKYSRARLIRLPVCGMLEDGTLDVGNSRCAKDGRTVPAQCTDHIIPLRAGGAMWDVWNHLSLCNPCNAWKMSTLERTMKTILPTPKIVETNANTGPKVSMPGSLNPMAPGHPQSNLDTDVNEPQQPYAEK